MSITSFPNLASRTSIASMDLDFFQSNACLLGSSTKDCWVF